MDCHALSIQNHRCQLPSGNHDIHQTHDGIRFVRFDSAGRVIIAQDSKLNATEAVAMWKENHKAELGKYSHYFKDVTKYTHIDVYRVLELFGVSDPCVQHAVKKLLVAGGRGNKDMEKDIKEAIVSLQRWEQMRYEDSNRSP